MNVQTKDPVMAVVIRDVADLRIGHLDHEARLRPLEKLKAQVGLFALLGSLIGGALVNYLFNH